MVAHTVMPLRARLCVTRITCPAAAACSVRCWGQVHRDLFPSIRHVAWTASAARRSRYNNKLHGQVRKVWPDAFHANGMLDGMPMNKRVLSRRGQSLGAGARYQACTARRRTSCAVYESRPEVGSSRNSTRGLVIMAMPMLVRFACKYTAVA